MELVFLSRVLSDRKNHYVTFSLKGPNIGVSELQKEDQCAGSSEPGERPEVRLARQAEARSCRL